MIDLERKLAETLREQAGEVTPNLDAAWAEQRRRQQRPSRRHRTAVWIAPLAAVLVVLTSVLVATELNTAQPPAPPGDGSETLHLSGFSTQDMSLLRVTDSVRLTEFAGQADAWSAYAFSAIATRTADSMLCVAAVPTGQELKDHVPQYGTKSPQCISARELPVRGVRAAYVGEAGGPLPPGKAVFLVTSEVRSLRLYDAAGDPVPAKEVGALVPAKETGVPGRDRVFLADVKPGSPPVRYELNPVQAHPAGR
ncbi:hypothetical protein [Amycolatopsis vastitatis]|uniref:Uncharacterized protein n=1 Tax=Amycolatopsis vastitatis TaxID=1905142 RepID=A0A229THZ5_9PSEU|nr:hypothetical protein [Amycolatopsis vastitatis]OXM70866.1 hypothetical protein CF165_03000 [Amycolatopsis vastitatis]